MRSERPDGRIESLVEIYSCLCDRRYTVTHRIDTDGWEKQNDTLETQIKTFQRSDILISLQLSPPLSFQPSVVSAVVFYRRNDQGG